MSKIKRTKKSSKEEQPEIKSIIDQQLGEYKESFNNGSISSILKQIKIDVKCKSENQKKLVNSIKDKEVTICDGLAGCGKTFLSCAEALRLLKNNFPLYKKIVIVKSVTTLKEEELGYIKGSIEEKISLPFYSFTGNFEKLIGKELLRSLKEKELIQEIPIAYLRGVTWDSSIIIIDEAQNISIDNMKTIMTRIGENSKLIILGDVRQIDIKKQNSSLSKIMDKFEPYEDFGIVRLGEEDIVRNKLISTINQVFENIENELNKK